MTEDFILLSHKKMFEDVWSWAGTKRKSNKNVGVDKFQISIELRTLLNDCKFWIENNTFEPDEIIIRFCHRLVKIHVFPNGNGRHSRLIADIMISNIYNKPIFTWGSSDLSKTSEMRNEYLEAIYSADSGILKPLIDFSRK